MTFTDEELTFLRRSVELAHEATQAGDEAFGTVLVDARGNIRAEERNRIAGGDGTQHPEFNLARWAANNMTPQERAEAVVYTSGEHCPMCSAAHAWVGLGEIVYVHSSEQLVAWLNEWGLSTGPVATLPIQQVAPEIPVRGPVQELEAEIKSLHKSVFAPEA